MPVDPDRPDERLNEQLGRTAEGARMQLFFRNTWSWQPGRQKPDLHIAAARRVRIDHPGLPPMQWRAEAEPQWLLCENETNRRRRGEPLASGCFKDGIGDWLVRGDAHAAHLGIVGTSGTKVAALQVLRLAAGESRCIAGHRAGRCPWRRGDQHRRWHHRLL